MNKVKKYCAAISAVLMGAWGAFAEELTTVETEAADLVDEVTANVNLLFPHVKTILLAVISIAALIWIGRKLKGIAFGRG